MKKLFFKNKNSENKYKTTKKRIIIAILSLLVLLLLVGGSYAAFDYNFLGNENVIEVDEVQLEFLESNTNIIEVTNALPMSDKEGVDQKETFDFAVTTNTSATTAIHYEIYIEELAASSGYTKLNKSDIRVFLTDFDGDIVTGPLLISDLNNMVLTRGEHNHSKYNVKIQDKYKLRVWIDEEVDPSRWDQNTKLEYRFKVGVRTTNYFTPEECFDVTAGGVILSYNCGDKTEGAEKHYDLVIPKTFSKVYTTLNAEDQAKILEADIVSEDELAQILQAATMGDYTYFDLMLMNYYMVTGNKLTTEKESLKGITSDLTETDKKNLAKFIIEYLGTEEYVPTEDEVLLEIENVIAGVKAGDADSIAAYNQILSLYIANGGKLSSSEIEGNILVAPRIIGFDAFKNEGLTSVYMPDSIINMYWAAFRSNNINHVKLSNNLDYFGEFAFANNKLTSILIPNHASLDMGTLEYNDLRILQLATSETSDGGIYNYCIGKFDKSNSKLFRIINKTGRAQSFEYALFGTNDYVSIESGIIKNAEYGDVEVTLR